MKKTLSLILAICTILSICSFSVAAAPEGTAISSAAEFAAMAADGKYYLANDITLDATYAETFKGTLDGNGKTVTVSAPMFATLENATIKNLNVEGAIAYTVAEGETAPDSAAVAVNAYEQYLASTGDNRPVVIASTASPYKFAKSVLSALTNDIPNSEFDTVDALSKLTHTALPAPLAELKNATVRFKDIYDKNDMYAAVCNCLEIK